MTKGQAIEILEGLKKSNEVCIKSSKIEDTPFTTIWKRQNEAIETVLSISSKDKIKEKIVALIPKKQESVKEIKVPDLKQYLVNGYEEIRQVKKENIELENQLEEEKKNKQLYEGALVTLSEFQQRDKDNKNEINRLKNKIKEKEQEINNINSQLNTYKIKQIEYDKREKNLKNEINENVKTKIDILKDNICNKIKNTKGNLSKDKIIDIIYKEAE